MRCYTFAQIKLQVIELVDESPALTKAALELAMRLLVRHLDRKDATETITDEKLGESLGWKPEKVSRAVKSLATSGLFEVRRGRWLRATEYSLADATWEEATARRRYVEKIADIRSAATPEKSRCCSRNLGRNAPEKSRLSCRTEIENGDAAADAATDVFVKHGDFALKLWRDAVLDDGMPPLERLSPEVVLDGAKGHWLPAKWPASRTTDAWEPQRRALLDGDRAEPIHERGGRRA